MDPPPVAREISVFWHNQEIWGHLTDFSYGDKFNWYGVTGFPYGDKFNWYGVTGFQ